MIENIEDAAQAACIAIGVEFKFVPSPKLGLWTMAWRVEDVLELVEKLARQS